MSIKWVLRDFFLKSWKERLRQAFTTMWWPMVYTVLYIPMSYNINETAHGTIAYIFLVIPAMFGWMMIVGHEFVIPKTMYLCPVTKEILREYVVKMALVRCASQIILSLAGVIILFVLKYCPWYIALFLLLNTLVIGISSCGVFAYTPVKNVMTACNLLSRGLAIFFAIIVSDADAGAYNAMFIIFIIEAIFVVPILYKCASNLENGIEKMICYEKAD